MIDYARHEARLNHTDKDGVPARVHLEVRAKQGSEYAISELEGVPFPLGMEYLYEAAVSLVGRSGVSMAGLCPISHSEIGEYCRLTGQDFNTLEVEALVRLDEVMRRPHEDEKKAVEPEQAKPTPVAAWPVRKKMAD